ncbi:MAG: DUF3124 domain-containing protein [Desulfofustis sp.]|nr:DUF3124 domain-containing protein [Desulfofustis sp.]
MRYRFLRPVLLLVLFGVLPLFSPLAAAAEPDSKTTGQTVYVPAYSHIYHGNKDAPLLLSVTLSIRNVDQDQTITVSVVDYHETKGALLKHFIDTPFTLGPLGSERFVVTQNDRSGGSGANFVVVWQAAAPVNPPIIETVMIGTQSQLGISFTSRGQALIK